MLDVPFRVMVQLFEISLHLVSVDCLLRAPSIFHIIKRVAEVLASLGLMLLVVAHTEPAEIKLARLAGHVHATLVLLDRAFALWARFGVDLQPAIRIFVALAESVDPEAEHFAVNRLMRYFEALVAETSIA